MVIHGDVSFMIISTILVLLMTPGLAFFYGGLVERKNSLTMMFYSFISIGIVTLLWSFGGFGFVFGSDISGIIGNPLDYFLFKDLIYSSNPIYNQNVPFLLFFMYQLTIAIIVAPFMTGAFADRLTIWGWIKILIPWMIFIYFPIAHSVWGGGFLGKLGFVDFAGGSVIHITSGFGCLSGAYYLGNRAEKNKENQFHIGFVALGATLLMIGWFGFNSGGTIVATNITSIIFANTIIAGATSMILWTILYYFEKKQFSFLEIIFGTIAGLIIITPASGYVSPKSAMVIGIIGAVICFYSSKLEKKFIDDALNVFAYHGVGGFIGTILIGLFAQSSINGVQASFKQFLVQFIGSTLIATYSVIVTYIIFIVADKIGKGIKVSNRIQKQGLDSLVFKDSFSDYNDD